MNIGRHILVSLMALAMLCMPRTIAAQTERHVADTTRFALADSLHRTVGRDLKVFAEPSASSVLSEDSEFSEFHENLDSAKIARARARDYRRETRQQRLATFTPDPANATWSALVFPGGGQIYNHKYWKLPIVYGGFLGCAYALNWNNQMYSDYSQAYLDIMDDDPGTASYEDFLPPRYNVEANKEYLTRVFKNRKDNYRRQRDLSIFCLDRKSVV